MSKSNRTQQYQEVRRVLWWVLIANLMITIIKIGVGAATGILAVVADGFHSLVDTSSNLIGLTAIRLADRPADEKHPYGYQKYETLGALAIGGLLIVAVWEIIQRVFENIVHGTQVEVTWVSFLIIALTFPINLFIVILEARAGRRLKSEILLADAAHTRTDLYVTGSVIFSMAGVWLGWHWLDWVVATAVVLVILKAAFQILSDAASSLADMAGINPTQIQEIATQVAGVRFVHNIRSRGNREAIFVDLHVKVDPSMSTGQAHGVASEVERKILDEFENVVDAIVHIEPARFEESNDWDRIAYGMRQIADGMGLGLHDLHVHVDQSGEYFIDLDLELNGELSLEAAHHLAEEFEARVQHYWPETSRITTHLEPVSPILRYPEQVADENIAQKIAAILEKETEIGDQFETDIHLEDGHAHVGLKIMMPANTSLQAAHQKAEAIKHELYRSFPSVNRVVIHVEPGK